MAIPIALTTIGISRPSASADPYEAVQDPDTTIAEGVRAQISTPSGNTVIVGGQETEYSMRFSCDPTDILAGDIVTDDTTGRMFRVIWCLPRYGFGLDMVQGELRLVVGVA